MAQFLLNLLGPNPSTPIFEVINMGIFSRLSDIINSNISAILDKAEDPEKMIRMMIQEMEETLVEVRSSTAKVIAEKKTVNRRIEQLGRQATDWEEKAELALKKEREDLARAALIEKSSVLTTIQMLEDELAKLDQTVDKLSHEIEQLQAKLTDARARQKTLLMRTTAAQSRVDVNQKLHSYSIDNAMNKFEYYERKIDQMEGQVDSLNIKQRGLQDEFEELANQEKIDQELESIKAKLNK
ncbi:phage shock protein PspA [Pseudohongiella sp.]|nr:phage shock protein PspA [Pseudohongiella sp.]